MPRRHFKYPSPPKKISIHKARQLNWVIYDLFTPLERLTEDIIQSCQSNWLFAWKRNASQPIREPADVGMNAFKTRFRWSGLFKTVGGVVDVRRKEDKTSSIGKAALAEREIESRGPGKSAHIHVASSRVTPFQANAMASPCPPHTHRWWQTSPEIEA